VASEDAGGRFVVMGVAPEIDHGARTVELGCAVGPEARGCGVGVAALRQLTDWALGLGMRRIFVLISVDNAAPKKVARPAGFRFEGVLRSAYVKPGVWADTESWSYVPTGE
jgi:RimJ/RimL family protein N-acetyltransferase